MITTAQILTLLAAVILVALLFIIYLLIHQRSQSKDTGALQLMLSLLSDLRNDVSTANVQSRSEMQERLDAMMRQMNTYQQSTSNHLIRQHESSAALIGDISGKLGTLESTNRQILNFAEQMKSLEKILQNPKQRGILGEFFLEALLQNLLPPAQYKMQFAFTNGEKVDAVLFFKDKVVPVDAKFSLENYNRLLSADNTAEQLQMDRLFRGDLKKRIDETAKYIRPEENTTDFALMFIPAEGIYYHLLNPQSSTSGINAVLPDVIQYAFSKKVIVVSPVSFYAYIQTILQGLKALQIEQSIKEVMLKVNELGKQLQQYEFYMDKLGKSIQTTADTHRYAQKELQKIDKTIVNINQIGKDNDEGQANLFQ
ncbi:MAG: DNA recombination protein RmuC [Sphingobacteriales bacterium]|nr:MAG: DNA recombination protein RmuC [Sphingobacteriales bacterium]